MKKLIGLITCLLVLTLAACDGQTAPTGQLPSPTIQGPDLTPLSLTPTPASNQPALATEAPLLSTATQSSQASFTPTAASEVQATATSAPAGAQLDLLDPTAYTWQPILEGVKLPVFLTGAGDGSGRLFILSQSGQIWVAKNGQLLPEPFLDISDRTSAPSGSGYYGERGLLGLAFHPRYAENGYFYLNYTDRQGDTVIARYSVSSDPDRSDPESEVSLLHLVQPFPNHNGGEMTFGPDGYLYIGLGDGGSAGDPFGNGQSLDTLLGKILRIDVDHGDPYAIPPDNPFANGGGKPEIWAYGLRNPWRFSFDALTEDLYIGDVGQNEWEEIDFLPAGTGGVNFGWNYREGNHPYKGSPTADLVLQGPVAEYSHDLGCSVTGGMVYRGLNLPNWQGVYLYSDYCSGRAWGLSRAPDGSWQNRLLYETGMQVTSFGTDDAGELYLLDYQGGVYQLQSK